MHSTLALSLVHRSMNQQMRSEQVKEQKQSSEQMVFPQSSLGNHSFY